MKRQITITVEGDGPAQSAHIAAEGMSEGEIIINLAEALHQTTKHTAKYHQCDSPGCQAKKIAARFEKAMDQAKAELDEEFDDDGALHTGREGSKDSSTLGVGRLDRKKSEGENNRTDDAS